MKQAQYSFTQIRRLEQIKFHLLFLGFEIQEWRFEGNHPYIHRYNDCTGENQRNRWKLGGGNIKMKKRKEGRRKKANKGSEMWTTPSHEWGPWSAPAQALLVPSRTSNRGICTSTTTWKSKPRNQENQEKSKSKIGNQRERKSTDPTIQMTTPMMEMRRERKAKGRPNRNPKGLQSPSQHIFSYVKFFSLFLGGVSCLFCRDSFFLSKGTHVLKAFSPTRR